MIDEGVEHGKVVTVLDDLLSMTDHCIRAFADVLAQSKLPELDPAGRTTMEAATQKLREMRTAVSGLLQWLNTPLPPIDPSKLPPSSGDRHAAGYISRDEMVARLRTGSAT
jgi:hypothetical protein